MTFVLQNFRMLWFEAKKKAVERNVNFVLWVIYENVECIGLLHFNIQITLAPSHPFRVSTRELYSLALSLVTHSSKSPVLGECSWVKFPDKSLVTHLLAPDIISHSVITKLKLNFYCPWHLGIKFISARPCHWQLLSVLTCLQCYATENRTIALCYNTMLRNLVQNVRCSFKYYDYTVHSYQDHQWGATVCCKEESPSCKDC